VSVARHHRPHSPARIVLLTAVSAVLPGTAHLLAGYRRTGLAIAATAAALVGGLVGFLLTTSKTRLLGMVVQPGWLTAIGIGALALAVGWVTLVLSSYAVLRRQDPAPASRAERAAAVAILVALCGAVVTPPVIAARFAYLQGNLITSVFADSPVGIAGGEGGMGADPWLGRERLNVLLIASDAGPDRTGTRTDSLVLVSIATRTGEVTMFSLPRNLQRAPMPAGPLRDIWPAGFPDLLNAVYQAVVDKPDLLAGARDSGAAALKGVVGEILGVHVDYYALANMQGFQEFISALGGVTIDVKERLPIGGLLADGTRVPPVGYIEPGRQRLSGEKAMWFARSRRDSTDYDRMARQRCLLGALARQADPLTVLRKFQSLASAAKKLASTDIPRGLLPPLVSLAHDISANGTIRSVTFVPPLISTADPDYAKIRSVVRKSLAPQPAARPPASRTAAPPAGPTRSPSPRATPTAPTAEVVDQVCAL